MKYFIHDGKEQKGPFTLEELQSQNIRASTSIWRDGLADWTGAGELEELKSVVKNSPPEFRSQLRALSPTPPTKSFEKKGKSSSYYLRGVLFILAILAIIYFYNKSHSRYSPLDFSTSQMPPPDPEHTTPQIYLNANGTYHPNFWGDKEVLNVTVANKATHTNYKDIRVRVEFFSQTHSVVTTQDYILYDYVPYGATKNFELKINKPQAAVSCGWGAVGATYY